MPHRPRAPVHAPPGLTTRSEPISETVALLDEAHRTLAAQDLAALLLEVRRLIAPLAAGSPPPPLVRTLPLRHPALSPASRVYLRPIAAELSTLRAPGSPSSPRAEAYGLLDAYLDDLAGRPKGSALPEPAG
jgi:hypothetical protein